MISQKELKHMRLQAWMRENKCDDIEYLGVKDGDYWYRIGHTKLHQTSLKILSL